MRQPAIETTRRRRAMAGALVLASILALLPLAATAQDESPAVASASPAASTEPVASADAAGTSTVDDLAAMIPAELAGVPVDPESMQLLAGQDMAQGSESVQRQYEAVTAATGVPVERMAQVNAFVETADGGSFYLSALRVPGAEAQVVLDAVLSVTMEEWDTIRVEAGEVGGLAVTVLSDEAFDGADPTYVYPLGDVLWIALGAESEVARTLQELTP